MGAKKGWTCLMCDRDIRSYEGKLSEIKLPSHFPVREGPKVNSYLKQQQMANEYKQIFMNGNRSNRRSSSFRKEDFNG